MKRSHLLFTCILILFSLNSCKDETTINENEASAVIENYLESNPEFKSTSFDFGELKFRGQKDQQKLAVYKDLENKGLIKMDLQEQKKVILSKDTTYVYLVALNDKAAPLVISQRRDKAEVKAISYLLDDAKPVNFIKTNNKTAKATVSLKKVETAFYPLIKSNDSNAGFITKTYKLKLKKDSGWIIEGN